MLIADRQTRDRISFNVTRCQTVMIWGVFNSSPVEYAGPLGRPLLDRSAVGQLSSLSSRTKWKRLQAGDKLRRVSPAGNRCHFVLLDTNESCPTADLSSIRPSQWSGLFDRWAVEHAPDDVTRWRTRMKLSSCGDGR